MPEAIVAEDGVTAIEIGSRHHGCATVKEVVAVTPWSVAVMVVFPETVAVVADFRSGPTGGFFGLNRTATLPGIQLITFLRT